jgi:hypothetical protein
VSYRLGRPGRATSNSANSNPALQICSARAPQRGAPDAKHRHDLRLWHASVQARQYMGAIDLPGIVQSLAANLFDQPAILARKMHFGLAHGNSSLQCMTTKRVYSCFVIYGVTY